MRVIKEGVYVLYDGNEVVYVGESDCVFRRVGQHIAQGKMVFDSFYVFPTWDRKKLEGFLIRTLNPKYNVSPGANYDLSFSDIFPTQTINETIKAYEAYRRDLPVSELSDVYGTYTGYLLRKLHDHNAPVYKIRDTWRLDYEWHNAHQQDIYNWLWKDEENLPNEQSI